MEELTVEAILGLQILVFSLLQTPTTVLTMVRL